MNLPCWSPHKEGVALAVRVTPRAAHSRIVGLQGNELKITLHASPTDGQANRELIQLLAQSFSLPKSQVEILSGDTSRSKRVLLRGVTTEGIAKTLEARFSEK